MLPVTAELSSAPENLTVTLTTNLYNGTTTTNNSTTLTANSKIKVADVPYAGIKSVGNDGDVYADALVEMGNILDALNSQMGGPIEGEYILPSLLNVIDALSVDLNDQYLSNLLLPWMEICTRCSMYFMLGTGDMSAGDLHEYVRAIYGEHGIESISESIGREINFYVRKPISSGDSDFFMHIYEDLINNVETFLNSINQVPSLIGFEEFFSETYTNLKTNMETWVDNVESFLVPTMPPSSKYTQPIYNANELFDYCKENSYPCLLITIRLDIADTSSPASFSGKLHIILGAV